MHPFSPSCYDPHWALYPRTYVAPRVPLRSITVDGNLDKEPWNDTRIAWSAPFQDIQGGVETDVGTLARDGISSIPVTRFKAAWDEENLYVAAILHPADGIATEAHFTDRNAPIYQRDSDFEVFVDPAGTTHNYKELEVNAINTVWNLLLDKPYGDGGQEHSGRVAKPGDALYWDVSNQRTAATVLEGKLNDPNHRGALWCVEMSLSIRDVLDRCHPHEKLRPRTHSHWRINFSRVEKQGDINWTWQPQVVWDPVPKAFAGKVQMHLPDAWGYLVFGTALESINDGSGSDGCDASSNRPQHARDPSWPHRLAAMNVYYALHAYKEQHGAFTSIMADLSLDQAIVQPFDVKIQCADDSFLVTVRGRVDSIAATVRGDRYLQVTSLDTDLETQ
jgi:hypothetical protein